MSRFVLSVLLAVLPNVCASAPPYVDLVVRVVVPCEVVLVPCPLLLNCAFFSMGYVS